MHLSLDTYIYGRNTKFLGEESISHGTVPTSKRHNHHIIQCPRSVEPLNCGMSIGLSCAMQKRCCCEEELVRSLTSVQVGAGDCESQWPSERRITCCRPDRSPVCHAATNQLPKLSNYACITQYSASDSLFFWSVFCPTNVFTRHWFCIPIVMSTCINFSYRQPAVQSLTALLVPVVSFLPLVFSCSTVFLCLYELTNKLW